MAGRATDVSASLAERQHPLEPGIEKLGQLSPRTSHATFRLQPGDRLRLILLAWPAPDRAVVTVREPADVDARQAAVVDLVNRWTTA